MSKNVIVVAGPNGSGKATFAYEYLYYELPNGELPKEDPYPLLRETDSDEEKC